MSPALNSPVLNFIILSLKRFYLWAFTLLVILPQTIWASEATLRVAFVYNFIKFIDWPNSDANSSIRLCVLGVSAEMHQALEQLHQKTANKQQIELVYLGPKIEANAPIDSCQMLYRPSLSAATVLPHPLPSGVVLVANEFTEQDTDVSIALLLSQEGKLEFAINPSAIAHAGVKVSSQLLKLAKNTDQTKGPI